MTRIELCVILLVMLLLGFCFYTLVNDVMPQVKYRLDTVKINKA